MTGRGSCATRPRVVQYGDSRQARHLYPRAMTNPITVRWVPGTTRKDNIALAHKLAAVGIESSIGWVDIGATYGSSDYPGSGEALFAELFG